jgi:hypothetical protein
MAHPYEHPVKKLLATAQESAKLMWQNYELHLKNPQRDAAWHAKKAELFAQCDAADRRLWRLREMAAEETGRWFNSDFSDFDG